MPLVIKLYALTTFILVVFAWAESFAGRLKTGVALAFLALLTLALTLLLAGKYPDGDR